MRNVSKAKHHIGMNKKTFKNSLCMRVRNSFMGGMADGNEQAKHNKNFTNRISQYFTVQFNL